MVGMRHLRMEGRSGKVEELGGLEGLHCWGGGGQAAGDPVGTEGVVGTLGVEPDGALGRYKVGGAEEGGVVVPQISLQLPKSPGKHREQGVLFLTHEQRRHFAEPLHQQHRE